MAGTKMKNSKFLIAVFCLALFVMVDAASAVPSNFTVNFTDKTVNINGVKTFPVAIYSMCMKYFEDTTGPCDPQESHLR